MNAEYVPGTPSPVKQFSDLTETLSPVIQFSISDAETPSPVRKFELLDTPSPVKRYMILQKSASKEQHKPLCEPSGHQSKRNLFSDSSDSEPSLKRRPGRPSKLDKFPEIVQTTNDLIEEHGVAAHEKRTDAIGSVGVSLQEIKNRLETKVPGLAEDGGISVHTVHRLMTPPNKQHKSAQRYKNLIQAKVGVKSNSLSKVHADSHFAKAQVKYALEMGAMYEDEIICFSSDAKAKVQVGNPAVSRYVTMKAFVMEYDMPQLPDHDFPVETKITPMGYMRLIPKMGTQATVEDSNGRQHYKFARTGPLDLFFRAGKYCKDSALSHYMDLKDILLPIIEAEQKKAVVIVVDNGPDWNKTSLKTLLAMGKLWADLKLDYLHVTSYAPGNSKYNPIEHAWAPMTVWWSALTLYADPSEPSSVVLDRAMATLVRSLQGKCYDGFPINGRFVPCNADNKDMTELDSLVDSLSKCSLRKQKQDEDLKNLQTELKFIYSHTAQRTYSLEYKRCKSDTCGHCTSFPLTAKKTLELMEKASCMFTPLPSSTLSGHYATFMECCSLAGHNTNLLKPDEGIPTKAGNIQWCENDSCLKVFQSKADRDRHNRVMHT